MKSFVSRFILFTALVTINVFSSNAQTGIRQIDFNNFTYEPYCVGEETQKVTVKNGEFFEEKAADGYAERFFFKALPAEYGDLNGDGQPEAIVLSFCNTGGSGNFSEGFVYTMKNGKPALLARIPGGDRADGGLRSARAENGVLVIESNEAGPNGGACCPEFVNTAHYRLRSDRLIETGKPVRRELYPKQRVSFPRGESGTAVKALIPAGEIKRFVVAARAGQSLTVSVNDKNVYLRVLEDAETTESAGTLAAKLPKSGDYTIELQNIAETDAQVFVNIKIR